MAYPVTRGAVRSRDRRHVVVVMQARSSAATGGSPSERYREHPFTFSNIFLLFLYSFFTELPDAEKERSVSKLHEGCTASRLGVEQLPLGQPRGTTSTKSCLGLLATGCPAISRVFERALTLGIPLDCSPTERDRLARCALARWLCLSLWHRNLMTSSYRHDRAERSECSSEHPVV